MELSAFTTKELANFLEDFQNIDSDNLCLRVAEHYAGVVPRREYCDYTVATFDEQDIVNYLITGETK